MIRVYVPVCILFLLHDKRLTSNSSTALHYLRQPPMRHETKWPQRGVTACSLEEYSRVHLDDMYVYVDRGSLKEEGWTRAFFYCVCVRVYLLRRIAVNHVRHERDLPVQEGGRSQVQWNLVCHHHCDVHSWRNSLNCPTWESTERERENEKRGT